MEKFLIGDKVRIIHLDDPFSQRYEGRVCTVTGTGVDFDGIPFIKVAEMSIKLYPACGDEIRKL